MATVIEEKDLVATLPASFATLAEFRHWMHATECPERGRFTYVNGGFEIDMSPERISGHNDIKTRMTTVLDTISEAEQLGVVFSDGVLLVNDDADLGCEPDMMFCSIETLRTGKATRRAWKSDEAGDMELHGTPDMVAEVVSNSSARKDTVDLRSAYFAAGIKEYWLIDGRGEEIELILLERGETEFMSVVPDADGYRKSAVFGRCFRFIREAHPVLGPRCSLLVRPEITP